MPIGGGVMSSEMIDFEGTSLEMQALAGFEAFHATGAAGLAPERDTGAGVSWSGDRR